MKNKVVAYFFAIYFLNNSKSRIIKAKSQNTYLQNLSYSDLKKKKK